jgi:hypothetical protein
LGDVDRRRVAVVARNADGSLTTVRSVVCHRTRPLARCLSLSTAEDAIRDADPRPPIDELGCSLFEYGRRLGSL